MISELCLETKRPFISELRQNWVIYSCVNGRTTLYYFLPSLGVHFNQSDAFITKRPVRAPIIQSSTEFPTDNKVQCVFLMVIWPEFHIERYRDDGHREDAPHFTKDTQGNLIGIKLKQRAMSSKVTLDDQTTQLSVLNYSVISETQCRRGNLRHSVTCISRVTVTHCYKAALTQYTSS